MTLIAAFRCRDNGILLCADRAEEDSYARRPIGKIWKFGGLKDCEVLIAGSGTTVTVKDACIEIDRSLRKSADAGMNLLTDHVSVIEESLKGTHLRYKEDLKQWPLGLLVVIAPRLAGNPPILYRTDRHHLVQEVLYYAYGTGKTIADYLADRLYVHGLPNNLLLTLATFIFREAERSAPGVGLGNDMVLIHTGGRKFGFLHTDSVKEIEAGIPGIKEAIWSYWQSYLKPPEWLKRYAADAESTA